ncbi:MAG: hypothetical protein ACE5FD_14685, partial [Anaerolineae bacterium]
MNSGFGGNVTAVFDLILPVLAGISLLAALYFGMRGLSERGRSGREAYSVGQVEARRASRVDWVRALAAGIVGLILLAVFMMTLPPPTKPAADEVVSPTAVPPTDTPTDQTDAATATLPPPVEITNTAEPTPTLP